LGKLTEPRVITSSGYYNLKPKWSNDSRKIYYQQGNTDVYPNIRVVDPDSGRDEKIFEGSVFAGNLSLDPSGEKLLFSKRDTYKNYYSYNDLYTYDLKRREVRRLTEGLRAVDADFSPDGSKIVLVKNELGTHTLMLTEKDGKNPRQLGSYEANALYFSPRFSPDGKKIAVAKWTPGGEQKIYLVDPATGKQERLTAEENLTSEANPSFSPGGDYIYFESDRTGIVNLYAFHLKTGRLFQITNVIGGAMMPAVSPDNQKIAYVSYSSGGYDIAVMDINPADWKEVPAGSAAQAAAWQTPSYSTSVSEAGNYKIHDYDPVPTLLPKFWLPVNYTNENGSQTYIYTQGSDVLEQHVYQLQLGYDFAAGRSQYSFIYNNNQFLPQISFMLGETAVPYGWNDTLLWMSEKDASVSFSLYDNRVFYEWDRQLFSVGYEQISISNIGSLESFPVKPSMGNINGVFLAWRYLNAKQYPKSISPEDGVDLTLKVSMNSAGLGSNYTFTNYTGNAAAYFSLPIPHHVLSPTLYGFYSKGEQLVQSDFSWKYLPLRGYPTTDLRGNKGALLSTEYTFPLIYAEKGFSYGYTFFDRVWGALFYDIGGATFDLFSNAKLKRSYGLELNLDAVLVWSYGLNLKLGYVKGIDENGEEKFYVNFGL
jgi:Tol biopolymer transport system component